jgi:hypothetical protein
MRKIFLSASALTAASALLGAGAANADVYNAYGGFSQTSPVWTYGYGATGSSFTAFSYFYTNDSDDSCSVAGDSVTCGEISPGGLPEVAKIIGNPVDSGTDLLVTNALYVHPGTSDDAIVQFTAPVASTYHVSGFFETLDTNPQPNGVKLLVVANGTTELSSVLQNQPASFPDTVGGVVPFNFNVALAVGQSIQFGVNDNGEFGNNGTGFDATIAAVPEPSAWVIMMAGVGILGAALRVSRRRPGIANA